MKLMYTKNEPGAKQVNEPKAKPYYTEFMFIGDEMFIEATMYFLVVEIL